MTEAAAGLGLIAPDHTAYRTYPDDRSATLIPAWPEPAPTLHNPDIGRFFRGATWWRPDEACREPRGRVCGETMVEQVAPIRLGQIVERESAGVALEDDAQLCDDLFAAHQVR